MLSLLTVFLSALRVSVVSLLELPTDITNRRERSHVDCTAKQTHTPRPTLGRGVSVAYLTFNQRGAGSNPSDPTAGA